MPNPAAALIAELDREAKATRKVLERVPLERLEWRPHAKSMTLGQLANHVARIPGNISRLAQGEGMDAAKSTGQPPQPGPDTDFAATLDAGLAESREILSGMDDGSAQAPWRLTFGDREVFAIPRLQVLRTMLLNHWYHHRGQLTVYLRLLDVPVPAVYGRSADETTLGGHAD
ncbi:MAG: DinB family protein [Acidobacteriota bacterium]|nr:DinB family protein [Acidobacteriota bacterium]